MSGWEVEDKVDYAMWESELTYYNERMDSLKENMKQVESKMEKIASKYSNP